MRKPWHTVFREADGNVSSLRVAMLFAVLVVVGTWSGLAIAHKPIPDIPPNARDVLAAVFAAKWLSQKHESDGPPTP